jgi:ribose transport system permease protein
MDALDSGTDQNPELTDTPPKLGNTATAVTTPITPGRRAIVVSTVMALVVLLTVEFLYFTFEAPFFFTWDNLLNILTAASVIGIIAAPGTMLLIAGQFDLSVGSGVAFCGMVLAVVAQDHGLALGVLAAVGAGAGLGILNGFLVTVIEINALITTLGTLAVFRGLTEVLSARPAPS